MVHISKLSDMYYGGLRYRTLLQHVTFFEEFWFFNSVNAQARCRAAESSKPDAISIIYMKAPKDWLRARNYMINEL